MHGLPLSHIGKQLFESVLEPHYLLFGLGLGGLRISLQRENSFLKVGDQFFGAVMGGGTRVMEWDAWVR